MITRTPSSGFRSLLILLLALGGAIPATGQPQAETFVRHAFALEHQPAGDLLEWIEPMLSDLGTVELRRASNTIVLRDAPSVLEEILPLVRAFDHAPREIELEIYLLEASRRQGEDPPSELPESVALGLGKLLRFNSYTMLAGGTISAVEGERVRYELGTKFLLRFRVGTVLYEQKIKLYGLEVTRDVGVEERLLQTHLNLFLEEPLVLALANDESSDRGLVVAVTVSQRPLDLLSVGAD